MTPPPVSPGATLGVIGGGQLGAMFAMAAKRLGYRVEAVSDVADCPAAHHADRVHVVSYADAPALARIARGLAAVTCEFFKQVVMHFRIELLAAVGLKCKIT
jgi:5-(carboxyamino)imidazole ribonucleotide synthase